MRVVSLKINSNVYPLKNTNSHYLLLNTTIIPLCNGKISLIFLWGIEHTQKSQKALKKLNKQTRELIKKFSQISQLNDSNKNTVGCDYYDLNDFNKVTLTKQDVAVLHLNISSLSSHINELKLLLSSFNLNFDIINKV